MMDVGEINKITIKSKSKSSYKCKRISINSGPKTFIFDCSGWITCGKDSQVPNAIAKKVNCLAD
jgi:hypothetical protein